MFLYLRWPKHNSYYTNCRVKLSTKRVGRVGLQFRTFLTSAPDGDDWSSSCPGLFTQSEGAPGIEWTASEWAHSPKVFTIENALAPPGNWFLLCTVRGVLVTNWAIPPAKKPTCCMKSNRIIWGPAVSVKRWWTSQITGQLCRLQHF